MPIDDTPKTTATTPSKTTARARLELRARRTSMIRRRIAATLLSTFSLAFGAIWQTGSMGAVAATTPTAAVATVAAATAASDTTSSDQASATSQATTLPSVTSSQS